MIVLEGITFAYAQGAPVLDDITLEIGDGEQVAIIGANGSGKTTLSRCLNGLLIPQQGTVRVDGFCTCEPTQLIQLRQRVGMVFQNPDDQLVSTSVESEIAFGLENLGVDRRDMQARVDTALADFDLEAYRRHPPHQLSGGQKQRVAIAAAMVLHPRYLVLDEPTSLLDPRNRDHVLELLQSLSQRFGTTVVHITQRAEEAFRAQRIIVLERGRIFADGGASALSRQGDALEELGLRLPFAIALQKQLQKKGLAPGGPAANTCSLHELQQQLGRWTLSPESRPPHAPAPPKLRTENLSYIHDAGLPTQQLGLDGVSLSVPTGAVLALLGPSGSGKTTLAQLLNALLEPHRGRIILDGRDIWQEELPRIRQRVGLVFQFPESQLFAETVAADVAYGPRNLGWSASRVEEAVTSALDLVDLPCGQFGARPPLTLSGGQRRRAALAGILAMEPEVLVLDEPTAGLDPGATEAMLQIFAQLATSGKTLVLITHDMDVVAELADHVVVLKEGRVVLLGEARSVLASEDFAALSGLEPPAAVRFCAGLHTPPPAQSMPLTLHQLIAALAPPAQAVDSSGAPTTDEHMS